MRNRYCLSRSVIQSMPSSRPRFQFYTRAPQKLLRHPRFASKHESTPRAAARAALYEGKNKRGPEIVVFLCLRHLRS